MTEQGIDMKLRQILWRTVLSRKVDEFKVIIEDDEIFNSYFGEQYVEKITAKSNKLLSLTVKLGFIYTLLILSLFASQNVENTEFELFGYGFKNISDFKESILLVAALISPISAIASAYKNYLDALVQECLAKLSPREDVRSYYSQVFVSDFSSGLINKHVDENIIQHGFSKAMEVIFALTLIFLVVALIGGSFFIQISVLIDVISNPSSPYYINLFVVTIASVSILFTWLTALLQLPMPEIDISNYLKLSEMEKNEPEKYQQYLSKSTAEDKKKDSRSTLIISALVYAVSYTLISLYYFPESLDGSSVFLTNAIFGLLLTILISIKAIRFVTNKSFDWLYKNYSTKDRKDYLNAFIRLKKVWLMNKVLVPLIVTIIYLYVFNLNSI